MPAGASLVKPETAEPPIRKAIAAGEILGAGVVLVPAFRQDCPKMDDEASYGPVVRLLQKLAPVAADAGIVLGLELSLSLEEHRKLMPLIGKFLGQDLLGRQWGRQHGASGRGARGY